MEQTPTLLPQTSPANQVQTAAILLRCRPWIYSMPGISNSSRSCEFPAAFQWQWPARIRWQCVCPSVQQQLELYPSWHYRYIWNLTELSAAGVLRSGWWQGPDCRETTLCFSEEARSFFPTIADRLCRPHRLYIMDTHCSVHGGKVTETWNWTLTSSSAEIKKVIGSEVKGSELYIWLAWLVK